MNYEIREELIPGTQIIMHSTYSIIDGGYIGDEKWAKKLVHKGIIPETRVGNKVCSIGFCAKEQKWYGWSHRAIYGFGIGSTTKPGNCGYVADNPEEMIDDHAAFFGDISPECADQHRAECQILPDRSGIRILHTPIELPVADSMEHAFEIVTGDAPEPPKQMIFEDAVSIRKCGRSTWTAATLLDAKQMACDFVEGVS